MSDAPEPIPLTDLELAIIAPYLAQIASATQAYRAAQASLDAIAKVIAGRVGAPVGQRYHLDAKGRRLVPITTTPGSPDEPPSV